MAFVPVPAAMASGDAANVDDDGGRRLVHDLRLFAITFATGFLFFSVWLA